MFSVALVRPLAACMLPVMIGSLLAMLEGLPALAYLYVGFPVATTIAAIWTTVQVRRTVVEVHLREDGVAVRSLIAAAAPKEPLSWYRLLDVRTRGMKTDITVGYDMFTLLESEWPDYADLQARLSRVLDESSRMRSQ